MDAQVSEHNHRYAGFWIRALAMIIDGIILSGIGYAFWGEAVAQVSSEGAYIQYAGWKGLIPVIYAVAFWMWLAATPGKLALGLKIIPAHGTRLTWKHTILRALFYFVSAAVFFLGFIWIAFDSKKQGWHDKIAGTYVVRK